MENVNFPESGEEIERALMDLGPLLGVSVKEEVLDDAPDTAALAAPPPLAPPPAVSTEPRIPYRIPIPSLPTYNM